MTRLSLLDETFSIDEIDEALFITNSDTGGGRASGTSTDSRSVTKITEGDINALLKTASGGHTKFDLVIPGELPGSIWRRAGQSGTA